ncbi:MAG: hypothetical protein HN416_09720 [Nitrospina sp.]|jgi:hypothetical protein|nr:hypothetical protein [Nitrospina sp.]
MSEIPENKAVNMDAKHDETKDQTTDTTPISGENMIPKARFDQVNVQKKEALDALKSVADLMVEDVPEKFKNLVPDLAPAQRIEWIRLAQKSGIFDLKIENGLDSKRPAGGKPPLDTSKMEPMEMMSHGYK